MQLNSLKRTNLCT